MIPRIVHRLLASKPRIYLRLLRLAGRGSIEKRVFLSLVRRGSVVLDIGANRGDFTELFADLAGTRGAVHAFEPVPPTFAMLKTRVGSRSNVHLHNIALGEIAGTATLHVPGEIDGQASLRTHEHGAWAESAERQHHECRMLALDEVARELPRLDFIKCDVEGAELLVLRGARETLERFSPVIFLEVFDEWTRAFDYTPADLVTFIRAAGYTTIFLVAESVRPLCDPAGIRGSVNLLCAKPGVLPDVLET